MAHPFSHLFALKGSRYYFVFAITATGVVPCGGPKKSPRILSIVQIIFSFWSFDISESILRNPKFIIGLDSLTNVLYIWLCLDDNRFCIDFPIESCKITVFPFGSICQILRVTKEA